MNSKQLKKLVLESYDKGLLDSEKVEKIAQFLKRNELKEYIKHIKRVENENTVVISLPFLPSEDERQKHSEIFQQKKIIYDIDPNLIVGTKIQENDLITEYNLKSTLENLYNHLEENYD